MDSTPPQLGEIRTWGLGYGGWNGKKWIYATHEGICRQLLEEELKKGFYDRLISKAPFPPVGQKIEAKPNVHYDPDCPPGKVYFVDPDFQDHINAHLDIINKGKKWYVAGPMRGLPNFNYDTFDEVAEEIKSQYRVAVFNPADLFERDQDRSLNEYLAAELPQLTECEAIVFLPGWWRSEGARIEYMVAKACGLKMYTAKERIFPSGIDEFIVEGWDFEEGVRAPADLEAANLVYGDRTNSYHNPYKDFQGTAKQWEATTNGKVTPHQVALMMSQLKLNRLNNNITHRDSLVDTIGYMLCLDWMLREDENNGIDGVHS